MAPLSRNLLLILSLLSSASAAAQPPSTPSQSILNAADTLASSGYTAMSLTIQLIAPTLPLPTSAVTTLTIFSPPDAAFSAAGQPSLAHLLLHFSPLSLSPASLLALPFSSSIPSLSPSKRLVITSNQPKTVSINNVGVSDSPIYDDGFVIVYAIDDFFEFNFNMNSSRNRPDSDLQCLKLEAVSRFGAASGVLKSRGYSVIASFLDMQIFGFLDQGGNSPEVRLTVFAPLDEQLIPFSEDFLRYHSVLMRHLVPCKVGWNDLEEMANGTVVSNNVMGFSLQITRNANHDVLMINGVEIVVPEMYDSEWLVIHGIRGAIPLPDDMEEDEMEAVQTKRNQVSVTRDPGEF